MKANLTKIGNSKGVIIPAQFLKECQFDDIVSIDIDDDRLVISKPETARSGWGAAFAKAAKKNKVSLQNDTLLIEDGLANDFDEDEWSW